MKRAGAIFESVFNTERIQKGYTRGCFLDYNRRKLIQKCSNRSLDFDDIMNIVDANSELFKATIREKGPLPDNVLKDRGITHIYI